MTRIAILMPMPWSVRNVVHSGVLRMLTDGGLESHLVCAPDANVDGHAAAASGPVAVHPMLDPPGEVRRGKAFLDETLTSAFHRQHRTRSYAIYRKWFGRHDGRRLRARRRLVEGAGAMCASLGATPILDRSLEQMWRRGRNLEPVRAQMRAIRPDLLWSTVNVSTREHPYRAASRDLGIPVVTSILSFDNLTSRGLLPRDAHYLVWGERMRSELLRLYPEVGEHQVTVTGTPQFDFHRRPDFLWSRTRTLSALGLNPVDRFFLYCASHSTLAPQEPALVAQLAARMATRPGLADRALVVRLHPLDEPGRWRAVADAACVRLSRAYGSGDDTGATGPTLDDHARLTSSLAHADACLNIASTATLDAAILDRPIICLDFADEPESPQEMLYAEYGCEHYAPIVAGGGVRVARRWLELLDAMQEAIERPGSDGVLRARMVADQCGLVDGRAADRVARTLIRLASATAGAGARQRMTVAGGLVTLA